ncbi:MAG: hypothetical protein C0606_09220 [Hyphomicrobiales bacterium]|nr:MAG: hypothetical protein C0606_09220 [Hyphomicrobiales bacterium]
MIVRTAILSLALMICAQPYIDTPEMRRFSKLLERSPVLIEHTMQTLDVSYRFLRWEHLRPITEAFDGINRTSHRYRL